MGRETVVAQDTGAGEPADRITFEGLQGAVDQLTARRFWRVPVDLWPVWLALPDLERLRMLRGTMLFLPTAPVPLDLEEPCGALLSPPGPQEDAREHYEWLLGRWCCVAAELAAVLPRCSRTAVYWGSEIRGRFSAGAMLYALADEAEQDCRDPRVPAVLRGAVASLCEDFAAVRPLRLVHLPGFGRFGPRFVLGRLHQGWLGQVEDGA